MFSTGASLLLCDLVTLEVSLEVSSEVLRLGWEDKVPGSVIWMEMITTRKKEDEDIIIFFFFFFDDSR